MPSICRPQRTNARESGRHFAAFMRPNSVVRRPFPCGLAQLAILAFASLTFAAEREVQAANTETLIASLGDDSYRVRRIAESQLLALGESVRDALTQTAANHADIEVRHRSGRVLKALDALRAKAYRESLEARLAEFLDDENAASKDYDFRGWKAYRTAVGSDRAAREMFAQMQREEPDLLSSVESDRKEVSKALVARSMAIGQSLSHPIPSFRTQVTPARAAALYFVAALEGVELDMRAGNQLYSLANQATVRTALADLDNQKVMRKVIGNWVALDQGGDKNTAYYKVILATTHNLPEGRQAGLNLIKKDLGAASYQQLQGLMAVARFGKAEDIDAIEPLLKNNTVCQTMTVNGVTYTTQVRDAALATLVQLTNQDHREYGFERLQKHPRAVFNTSTMGFPRDDTTARDAAILKWQTWRAKQKKAKGD
jgi:hypothetical protein